MQLPKQLILDTSPLVLLALSQFYEQTARASSLALQDGLASGYTAEQLERLEESLEMAPNVLLSPYCLAESTNLFSCPLWPLPCGSPCPGSVPMVAAVRRQCLGSLQSPHRAGHRKGPTVPADRRSS